MPVLEPCDDRFERIARQEGEDDRNEHCLAPPQRADDGEDWNNANRRDRSLDREKRVECASIPIGTGWRDGACGLVDNRRRRGGQII
jgi:hypothetical protein